MQYRNNSKEVPEIFHKSVNVIEYTKGFHEHHETTNCRPSVKFHIFLYLEKLSTGV
jgi:hypothetical protein